MFGLPISLSELAHDLEVEIDALSGAQDGPVDEPETAQGPGSEEFADGELAPDVAAAQLHAEPAPISTPAKEDK